jgi:hypothetical protein
MKTHTVSMARLVRNGDTIFRSTLRGDCGGERARWRGRISCVPRNDWAFAAGLGVPFSEASSFCGTMEPFEKEQEKWSTRGMWRKAPLYWTTR